MNSSYLIRKKLSKHDTTNGLHSNIIMFVYLLQFRSQENKIYAKNFT